MKKQLFSFPIYILLLAFLIGISSSNLYAQTFISPDYQSPDVLQWQMDHSLLAEICEASAGVLTLNVEGNCLKDEQLLVSTNDTHQTAEGYTLHYILWDITNPQSPRFKGINTTGIFDAPMETKTYQVYAYSEKTEDAPVPSPISAPNTAIGDVGSESGGCFQVVSTGAFEIVGKLRLDNVSSVEGSNIHIYEICGGELPYSYDFVKDGGFSNLDEFPSSMPNCRRVRLLYTSGVNWSFTVRDASDCENTLSYSSANSLLPIIKSYQVAPETCPDDYDGAISLVVEGGVQCEIPDLPYTYSWEGPNGFVSDADNITKIQSGHYKVVVTDCIGNSTSEEIYVRRGGGDMGNGRARGGCRRAAGKTAISHTALEWIEVYPNPISQQGFIEFSLTQNARLEAQLLNLNGQRVVEVYSGNIESGVEQRLPLLVGGLPEGVYILQLQADSGWQHFEKVQVLK